jgi:hypothetical protein
VPINLGVLYEDSLSTTVSLTVEEGLPEQSMTVRYRYMLITRRLEEEMRPFFWKRKWLMRDDGVPKDGEGGETDDGDEEEEDEEAEEGLSRQERIRGQMGILEKVVKSWELEEADGTPIAPTLANFDAGKIPEQVVFQVFVRLFGYFAPPKATSTSSNSTSKSDPVAPVARRGGGKSKTSAARREPSLMDGSPGN